jgi:hypothetical protein
MDLALESYRENFEKLLTEFSPTIPSLLEEYGELYHNNIRKFAYINELNTEVKMSHYTEYYNSGFRPLKLLIIITKYI